MKNDLIFTNVGENFDRSSNKYKSSNNKNSLYDFFETILND